MEIDESDCDAHALPLERHCNEQEKREKRDVLPWPGPWPEGAVLPPAESMSLVTDDGTGFGTAAAALPGAYKLCHLAAESAGQEESLVMELNGKYEQRVSGLRSSIEELEKSMEEAFSPHQHPTSADPAAHSAFQERGPSADLKMLQSCQQRLQRSGSEAAIVVQEVGEIYHTIDKLRLEFEEALAHDRY